MGSSQVNNVMSIPTHLCTCSCGAGNASIAIDWICTNSFLTGSAEHELGLNAIPSLFLAIHQSSEKSVSPLERFPIISCPFDPCCMDRKQGYKKFQVLAWVEL